MESRKLVWQNICIRLCSGVELRRSRVHGAEGQTELGKNNSAPAGNRTRVCTVAGYYSTTRPLVLCGLTSYISASGPTSQNTVDRLI
ncbi:hypothetical protein POUND7_002245 [Theobroma cacao]